MARRLAILSALVLAGCSGEAIERLPTTPEEPLTRVSFWGKVIDGTGVCIPGATVTVVAGQALGATATQSSDRCDLWSDDGGFIFQNLVAGVALTIHATAPGYLPEAWTFVARTGPLTPIGLDMTPAP